jgi:hypothetical protein
VCFNSHGKTDRVNRPLLGLTERARECCLILSDFQIYHGEEQIAFDEFMSILTNTLSWIVIVLAH